MFVGENFNDMLVVSGDKALYDAHVKVFDEHDLPQRKTDDRYGQPGKIAVDSAPGFTAEFSPQKTGDMVADAYKKAAGGPSPSWSPDVSYRRLTRTGLGSERACASLLSFDAN